MYQPWSSTLIRNDAQQGVYGIHRSVFTSDDVLRLEQEHIFSTCWLYAGHVSELRKPGDFVSRKIANRRVILTRGSDGKVRALFNTCTHKGTLVCREPSGNAKSFRCPYHSWLFDNAGKLVSVPGEEAYGPHFNRSDYNLVEVPRLDLCHGFIFVSFARDGETLTEYLRGVVDQLGLIADEGEYGMEIAGGTHLYSMKTNWKLLLENSTDAYHLMPVHGRYVNFLTESMGAEEMVRFQSSIQSGVTALGNGHAVTETSPPLGGRITAYWDPCFGEENRVRIQERRRWFENRHGAERAAKICDTVRIVQIFPNVVINDIQAVNIRQFWPTAPGAIDVSAWALVPSGQNESDRLFALNSFVIFLGPGGFATPDDIDILESCQTGFANSEVDWSYNSRGMLTERSGRPPPDDESQMREFWEKWRAMIDAGVKGSNEMAIPSHVVVAS